MFSRFAKQAIGSSTENYKIDLDVSYFKGIKQIFFNSGKLTGFTMVSLFILRGLLFLFSDLWLGFWSNKVFRISNNFYLTVYICISVSTALFFLISSLFFKKVARWGVMKVYKDTIHSII